jgi:L-fuconolactonase
MTVIDAHQHFWNFDRVDYPYLPKHLDLIYRTFEEGDLEPLLDRAGVDRTVLVQSMDSFADTDYMLEVADRWPRVAAVVAWVPLVDTDAAAAALDRFAAHPRFVGIRHLIHQEPDPDWLIREDVGRGLDLLAARGVRYDVVAVLPRHLELVPLLSERHPALRMVIDHLGSPPIAAGGWEPWAGQLTEAARNPNVFVKLSGLGTLAAWDSWTVDDLRRYADHAFAIFGPSRVMFGGDWPISRLAGGYQPIWEAIQELLRGLSAVEREQVLGGTATAFYGIR